MQGKKIVGFEYLPNYFLIKYKHNTMLQQILKK